MLDPIKSKQDQGHVAAYSYKNFERGTMLCFSWYPTSHMCQSAVSPSRCSRSKARPRLYRSKIGRCSLGGLSWERIPASRIVHPLRKFSFSLGRRDDERLSASDDGPAIPCGLGLGPQLVGETVEVLCWPGLPSRCHRVEKRMARAMSAEQPQHDYIHPEKRAAFPVRLVTCATDRAFSSLRYIPNFLLTIIRPQPQLLL